MKYIKPYEPAVTLFGRDGSVRVFKSMSAAYRALGLPWIRENVGAHFSVFVCREHYTALFEPSKSIYAEADYVMRNDLGEILTAQSFQPLREKEIKRRYWGRYAQWNGEGPVPGTRKYRGGRYYFRRIRHLNARRLCFTIAEEGEVPPRAARDVHHLPNNWDDYGVAAREDINWKRFRKQQWKAG